MSAADASSESQPKLVSSRPQEDVASLLPLVYEQLYRLAERQLRQERPGHTLQPTALIHEAYCRLAGDRRIPWDGPGHFYAAAAEAMRRVLLDYAKARAREKRGGGRKKVPLELVDVVHFEDAEEILSLDQAICRLEEQHPEVAAVVRMRFFAGLSIGDTAQALGLSERTINRRWEFARAWLFRELHSGETDGTH